MTVKDLLTDTYAELCEKDNARFLGYNTANGSRMYGTLNKIPMGSCVETPCAENLMVGMALGMSLEGNLLPVICFERHEFVLFALGMIAVMGDKFKSVTGERVPLIIRAIKGGSKPLDPGEQHKVDYREAITLACANSSVIMQEDVSYERIKKELKRSPSGIVLIMEERDGYEQTVG